MKETEEKNEKIFQGFSIKPYEEFSNDGREYSSTKSLESLNLYLQTSKHGVVITGNSGTGKTALVRQFANQNLSRVFKSDLVKVIHIKNGYFSQKPSVDQVLKDISNMILEYKSDVIILYVKLHKKEELEAIQNICETYFNEIAKFYSLQALKVILEATTQNDKEVDYIIEETSSTYNLISCSIPKNMNMTINMLMPRIQELSLEYGISWHMQDLQFFYVIARGLNEVEAITSTYLNVLECAFILSKKEGYSMLCRSVAKNIAKDAFELLDNMSEHEKQLLAAHEAGHTLLYLVSNNVKVSFVSIISGVHYMGITAIDEEINTFKVKDREYFIKDIATSLAGRMAESVFDEKANYSDGARGDLNNAMSKVDCMFFKLGLSESLGKNYVLVNKEDDMSEALKVRVEAEKRDVLKEAGDYAQKAFWEHKQFFLDLSKRLADELAICNDDLYDMWHKYLKSKESAETQEAKKG